MENILINKLPSRTWNWLNVNEASLQWDSENQVVLPKLEAKAAAGEAPETTVFTVKGEGEYSAQEIDLAAEDGSTLTVFEDLTAAKKLAVGTNINVGKNALVHLVQLISADQGGLTRSAVRGECAEGGRIELVQVIIGRGDLYSDSDIELTGNGSSFNADIGYLGRGEQTIDLNLVCNHYGKKTESEINANGALKDSSKKVFRGTIDFKTGSSDSVGNEKETVLMLGDGVVNKTVPLILCSEENVVGNHGATIGELDKDTLFYFGSRGIAREQAENILARAAIERLARTMKDGALGERIMNKLDEEI